MLTIFLLVCSVGSMVLTTYYLDYQVDGVINHPAIILLSVFVGVITFFVVAFLFMEITYYLFAKNKPHTLRIKHIIGKQIMSVPMHLFHIKTTVHGKENLPQDPRFLIYSNHTSELDISVLMHHLPYYPVAFLAKEQVGRYPSIGKWSKSIGCVMLNRDDNRQGSKAVSDVIDHVNRGSTMVVFPEGTLTRDVGHLLKFRSGAFKIALESGVPLVPVTIIKEAKYRSRIWPLPRRMDLKIHPPIPYEDIKELSSKQLNQRVRDIIASALIQPTT